MKKIIALMIFAVLLVCGSITATAADTQASLYSYYGDDMLFKQKDDAVFAGTATAGTKITSTLFNSQNTQIAAAETVALADGTFSLSFVAPAGSFEEYRIVLTADGEVFEELNGVVFGEMWLAGGQSNMQMALISSKTGYQMALENKRGSDALRFFYIPYMGGEYKGDQNNMPAQPLVDYECTTGWYKGSDVKAFELSAIGYYFAESLIAELDMPVGILNANMGGTSIITWLSRETIENNAAVLADCKSDGRYIPLENWNETKVNFSIDMTANFNKIIAPLKNFRLSGMLWYQGEGDVAWQFGRYSRAFDALQSSYTEYFDYEGGDLPIVFTQLASYVYGELTALQNTNYEFSVIQQQKPESRAMTSILDVPLDYTVESHAIHPLCKKEVADKMFYAAMGLVYDRYDSYTAATVSATEVRDSSIYITFRDVGDGLVADGNVLSGFTVCGADGVYVAAKAEIVSADTVKVYSPSVMSPAGAAYAYTQSNQHANLFASVNGEKALAVSPFVTNPGLNYHHWHNDFWATCDFESIWHCHTNEYSGFYNTWNSNGATISFAESEFDSGKALNVTSQTAQFTISPNFMYSEGGKFAHFQDVDYNWSDYGALTFKIKVAPGQTVHFDGVMLRLNDTLWVAPAIKDTNLVGCTVEGDGNVHSITLDLNRLYVYADTVTSPYDSSILSVIPAVDFVFTGISGENVSFTVDNFAFASEDLSYDEPDDNNTQSVSFFDKIRAFFRTLFAKIALFFQNLF